MKRLFYSLVILSSMMFACNISTPGTPIVVTSPPVVTITPLVTVPPVEPVTPMVTLSPVDTLAPIVTVEPIATNLNCNELSLFLDPALASGFSCETIPESTEGMEMFPQYTRLTLQGYILSGKFFEPHLALLPIQRYSELLPDLVSGSVSDLQALVSGGAAGEPLPFLPAFNAAQMFHAQFLALPFASGGGIRYMTEYAQYYATVNNTDLFYTYQGLTSDGKYWVSAILPINNPILAANADTLPAGMSMEDFNNNYGSYITGMIDQLNSQASDSYTPSLAALDALVASITIQP